jgi:hypothetical protein
MNVNEKYIVFWINGQYTVVCHVQMAGIDTVYKLYSIVHFSVALVPIVYSVTGTAMFDWWSLRTDIISDVDHPG